MLKTISFLQTIIFVLLAGCAVDPAEQERRAADISRVEQMGDADKLFIVDCLLPGQIRKLGSQITYLTARRPIKTSAGECEIRGGEYVAYDRANQTTALQTWLPIAQTGDPEAQTYVGEIYEKGMGLAANYPTAAEWYRKAALQNNSRAQINLGYLYEKGHGVNKDLTTAMDWYQKASGLEPKDLPYAATLNTSNTSPDSELLESVNLLKTELADSRNEAKVLSEQLNRKQQKLQESLAALQNYQKERDKTQAQLVNAESQNNAAESAQLKSILVAKDNALNNQQKEVADLKIQYEQKITELTQKLSATEKRANQIYQQLNTQKTAADESQLKLMTAEAQLANTQKQLLDAHRTYNEKTLSLDKSVQETTAKELQKLQASHQQALEDVQKSLIERENQLQKSQTIISKLEAEKQKYEQQIQNLQKTTVASSVAQKPVIEIIDPPFVLVRGIPTIKLRSAVKQRQIIGKVTSKTAILSVLINDIQNTLDDRGIFNATVNIQGEKTPVNVVAVDKNGTRQSLEFLLAFEGPATTSQRDNETIENPITQNPWKDINLGNYYALIIGNDHYQKIPSLDTPANDAREVDTILRTQYGFKTKLLLDANRYQILSAMNELRGSLTENDNLVIYYAGHGELDQVNMRGHWLPVDADADNNANWISTVSITDILNSMSSRHILVVADSCYSGAMTRASIARLDAGMSDTKKSEWLKAMLKAKSRTVLTSGGLKPVMDGGGGDHSVFANAFIQALQNNHGLLEGQELYRNVSANVVAIAANYEVEQVPQYAPVAHAGHEAGEFFFMPKDNHL